MYHFDCIGLVNWCLAKLLSTGISLDIAQVCNKKRVKVKNAQGKTETQLEDKDLGFFDEVDKPFSDHRVGDVLCRLAVPGHGDHIAFVTSGGTVEASSTSTGVITSNDRKGKWNFHMRPSNLVFKKYLGIK